MSSEEGWYEIIPCLYLLALPQSLAATLVYDLLVHRMILFRKSHIALLSRARPSGEDQDIGLRLTALPLEILHLIISHLSPADTACLALCNHFLLVVLGKHKLSVLREGDRASFLITLTRDLPRHFYHHECSRLHLRDHITPPWSDSQPLKCPRYTREWAEMEFWYSFRTQPGYSSYLLHFSHVQLAMKRHRHGSEHGISTDLLSYVEVHIAGKKKDPKRMTTLVSVEARISVKTTSLCLRIQQWVFLRTDDPAELFTWNNFLGICEHLHTPAAISQLARSELGARCTNAQIPISTSVKKCRHCNTDFQIEIRRLIGEGLALVITKWLDLGSGLTPMDIKWAYYRTIDRSPEIDESQIPGDVRLLFESEPGLSHDSLSSQNASYLGKDRFRKVMDHEPYSNKWMLQAGKRMSFFERLKEHQDIICPLALIVGHIISGSLVLWGYCYGGSG